MIIEFVSVLIVLFAYLCIHIEYTKWKLNKQLKNTIALTDWPVVGFGATYRNKNEQINVMKAMLSDVTKPRLPLRLWLGTKLLLIISDPEDLKIIFNSTNCLDKSESYEHILAMSLGSMRKNVWKNERRAFNPTFRPAIVNPFTPTLNDITMELCTDLKQLSSYEAGTQFDDLLTRTVFQQIIQTLFMSDFRLSVSDSVKMRDAVMTLEAIMKYRTYSFWYHWDFIYHRSRLYQKELNATNVIKNMLQRITANTSEQRSCNDDADAQRSSTIVQMILQKFKQREVTMPYVEDNLMMVFIAGTTTTLITIKYILLMLAIHQDYQDRVVKELRSIFASVDEPVTMDSLQQMPWIDLVVKEVVRLFPALPIIARTCTEDLNITRGVVPKGTVLSFLLHLINRDQKYWGANANDFYPERFHHDNMNNQNVHPYSYMSFSKGPRNCIGAKYGQMSLKILLAILLRHFKFTTTMKMQDIRFHWHISAFMVAKRPFEIEPRVF